MVFCIIVSLQDAADQVRLRFVTSFPSYFEDALLEPTCLCSVETLRG